MSRDGGLSSRLYPGTVIHTRLKPRRHRLRRRIPMILIDLDELPTLDSMLLAVDRFGPLSIEARHHLAGDRAPLKAQIERLLSDRGLATGGAVRLLCMPAVFGQVFNPLSVYFCHGREGALSAIVYEVNNTFGSRHCYVLPVLGEGPFSQACAKDFHVSPFLESDLSYAFNVTPPGPRVSIAIQVSDREGVVLGASFTGVARPLTNATLAGVIVRHPLLMLEVLAGIHWEALKMFVKGIRPPPAVARAASGRPSPLT